MTSRGFKSRTLTSISNNSETPIIAAGGEKIKRNLFSLRVTNESASDVVLKLRESIAGNIVDYLAVKAGQTAGWVLHSDDAMEQTDENAAWTLEASASVSTLRVIAQWVQIQRV